MFSTIISLFEHGFSLVNSLNFTIFNECFYFDYIKILNFNYGVEHFFTCNTCYTSFFIKTFVIA